MNDHSMLVRIEGQHPLTRFLHRLPLLSGVFLCGRTALLQRPPHSAGHGLECISDIGQFTANGLRIGIPQRFRQAAEIVPTGIYPIFAAEHIGDAIAPERIRLRGVGQGLQPVAAFNYGARRFARVRKAAIFTISTAFVFMAVLNSLCWFNAEPLIRLFRDDPEVTAVALPALRYQCVAMFLQPVIIVTNMMFQSIGKSGRATFLACCRQGVCFIPLILTLPRIWGLSGIELCQPIADGLTFCISVPFLLPFLKELKEQGDEE